MSIPVDDTLKARNDALFEVVAGIIGHRAYNSGAFPDPTQLLPGSVIVASDLAYALYRNTGTQWLPVGGSGGSATGLTASISDATGPYTHSLSLGAIADGTWMKIAAGDPSRYADFYGTYKSFVNPTHNDNVFRLGHNVDPGGGQVIPGTMSLFDSWESYFNGGHVQNERHISFTDVNGLETRFFSAEGHTDTSTALYIAATTVQISSGRNSGATPGLAINSLLTEISAPSGVPRVIANDADSTVTMANGLGADNNRATIVAYSNGSVVITANSTGAGGASGIGRLMSTAGVAYEWDHTLSRMLAPNQTGQVYIDNNAFQLQVAGTEIFRASPLAMSIFDSTLVTMPRSAVGTNTRGDQISNLLVRNATASTAIAPVQNSPGVTLTGHGWNTAAAGSDQGVSWMMQVQPVSAATATGTFAWLYSSDQANYANMMTLTSAGGLSVSSLLGAYTLSGTPTLGASLAVGTDNSFSVGDVTHRLAALSAIQLQSGASSLSLLSGVVDGAGAVAEVSDTSASYVTNGAKLHSWRTGAAEKASITKTATDWTLDFVGVGSYRSAIATGAGAVAHAYDSVNSLTTAGALLASFRNATVQKAALDKDGNLLVPRVDALAAGALQLGGANATSISHAVVATPTSAAGADLGTTALYWGALHANSASGVVLHADATNTNKATLTATPTAARALLLPDDSGTLVVATAATLAANQVVFGASATKVSSSTKLTWDDTNSRFKIGTVGPTTYTAQIVGTSANNDLIALENTDATKYSSIAFVDSGGTAQVAMGWANSTVVDTAARSKWNFFQGTNDVFFNRGSGAASIFLKGSNGFVGVNNTAPGSQLDVVAPASAGAPNTVLLVTAPANTNQTLSTEVTQVNLNLSASRQWATGSFALQREMRIQAPTYTAVGASTITDAATLSIDGPPVASTNVTLTRSHDLRLGLGKILSNQVLATGPAFTFDTGPNTYNALTNLLVAFRTNNQLCGGFYADSTPAFYIQGFNQSNSAALVFLKLTASAAQFGNSTSVVGASDLSTSFGTSATRASQVWSREYAGVEQTIAAAASINLSAAAGQTIRITLSATAITTITATAGNPDQRMTVHVIQDGTGSRSISGWSVSFLLAGGAYTPTATLNKRDVLTFMWDNTSSKWVEVSRSMNL